MTLNFDGKKSLILRWRLEVKNIFSNIWRTASHSVYFLKKTVPTLVALPPDIYMHFLYEKTLQTRRQLCFQTVNEIFINNSLLNWQCPTNRVVKKDQNRFREVEWGQL
jgi:hypothetical protein